MLRASFLPASAVAVRRAICGPVCLSAPRSTRGAVHSCSQYVTRPPFWHTHPNGQTVYVTEGVGLCQRRGSPVEVIRPGDRVFFEPGEDHWHGAAPNRFMTHLAMQEVDEQGSPVTWGEHVSDEEYGAAPSIDQ